jgi:hypothetical protein
MITKKSGNIKQIDTIVSMTFEHQKTNKSLLYPTYKRYPKIQHLPKPVTLLATSSRNHSPTSVQSRVTSYQIDLELFLSIDLYPNAEELKMLGDQALWG